MVAVASSTTLWVACLLVVHESSFVFSWTSCRSSLFVSTFSKIRAGHHAMDRLVTTSFAKKEDEQEEESPSKKGKSRRYELGLGKNRPIGSCKTTPSSSPPQQEEEHPHNVVREEDLDATSNWMALSNATSNWMTPEPVSKPESSPPQPIYDLGVGQNEQQPQGKPIRTKRIITKNDEESSTLKRALWDEEHYATNSGTASSSVPVYDSNKATIPKPSVMYPDLDLSIPETVYSRGDDGVDMVWDILRYEAQCEAQREPLLVSFLHSTILNHNSLESALAFHLANKLASPAMISTQIQSLVMEALENDNGDFGRSLRADMMAVRDRDPACTCLPDVFLYFKGFHALQTHRVGHYMYTSGRKVLASFLQSQMSQNFQIDIHPNATMGRGIMLDHGTGIVVGETARVGHNCSILHHVTLGGSGKQGVARHPKVGDGVLLGAGVSVLGNVQIGDGCQIGAGTLVISDLPPHSVAVGVPARIIGSFVDVTVQPSLDMNQMMGSRDFDRNIIFESEGI